MKFLSLEGVKLLKIKLQINEETREQSFEETKLESNEETRDQSLKETILIYAANNLS